MICPRSPDNGDGKCKYNTSCSHSIEHHILKECEDTGMNCPKCIESFEVDFITQEEMVI